MWRAVAYLMLAPLLVVVWLANLAWLAAGLLHAMGHLVAARALGVEVETASLGVGPALVRRGRWQLSLLPGAFVRADVQGVGPVRAGAFLAAGPLGSLCTAWLVLFIAFSAQGIVGIQRQQPLPDDVRVVGEVFPRSAAEAAGVLAGDELVALDGHPVEAWSELPGRLRPAEMELRVVRDGQPVDLQVTPADYEGRLVLGIARGAGPMVLETYGPAHAAGRATGFVTSFFGGLTSLARTGPAAALGGPVAIFEAAEPSPRGSWMGLAALLVASRGMLLFGYNLLPLPFSDVLTGLDLASLRLRGRPLPMKALTVAGSAMLLALALFVFVMDVMRFLAL